jgi:imidazolonepropionase-like amidohydrolase
VLEADTQLKALTGGVVLRSPYDAPIHDAIILVEGATIVAVGPANSVAIPSNAERFDCAGCTVVAGLWNSHVHFFERRWVQGGAMPAEELTRQLEDFTRYGFTNVFDTGSMWSNTGAIRERIESGAVRGPKIRTTGEAILPPGAMPPDEILRVLGYMKFAAPEVSTEEEAVAAVRQLVDAGVDAIKFFASIPRTWAPLEENVIDAIVREAHHAGKRVFVHPNTGDDVKSALRRGADVIAHTTPVSGPWDESILELVSAYVAALTPTLALWKHVMRHDRISIQEKYVKTALDQVRAWREAGGAVLFGPDVGAVEYDPTEEYALMAESGMSFNDILASLTTTPAHYFGDSTREGRIAEKCSADIVAVNGDPSRDVRTLADVRYTIRAGKVIYRSLV